MSRFFSPLMRIFLRPLLGSKILNDLEQIAAREIIYEIVMVRNRRVISSLNDLFEADKEQSRLHGLDGEDYFIRAVAEDGTILEKFRPTGLSGLRQDAEIMAATGESISKTFEIQNIDDVIAGLTRLKDRGVETVYIGPIYSRSRPGEEMSQLPRPEGRGKEGGDDWGKEVRDL